MTSADNPFTPFLEAQGVLILDGGLATALEARGKDLNDPLWSAKVLIEDPEAIRAVHEAYLRAGADCIATASYQATLPGFRERGMSHEGAVELLRLSVRLAVEARDAFWADPANRVGRLKPLVAGSVGPYGAWLADGSEYRGEYGMWRDELADFHRERWEILAGSEADILACETIPSGPEVKAVLGLLQETPGAWAWISMSCRDRSHLSDGTPLVEVARACDAAAGVAAVGVNCVPPRWVPDLVAELRRGTRKPVLAYPNSGEVWDSATRTWTGVATGAAIDVAIDGAIEVAIDVDWGASAAEWHRLGAAGVGGCCRVGPEAIARMRGHLLDGARRGHGPREAP